MENLNMYHIAADLRRIAIEDGTPMHFTAHQGPNGNDMISVTALNFYGATMYTDLDFSDCMLYGSETDFGFSDMADFGGIKDEDDSQYMDLLRAIFRNLKDAARSGPIVRDENGNELYYNSAVQIMDDDLREELSMKLAPCTPQEFFEAYAEAHEAKFGEDFEPWVGGQW